MALIELSKVGKSYLIGKHRTLEVLRDISMKVEAGEFAAIMGPSGSGKSTLMHIIGCLDQPSTGAYTLAGETISDLSSGKLVRIRRERIGFVFQSFNLLSRLSALQNVELPMIYSGTPNRSERARELLRTVGLEDRMHHRPTELSGGEQQRVAIARALANNPSLILADEPTGNLDSRSGQEIVQLFRHLHEQGRTIIMVTHDERLAQEAQRVIRLHDGEVQHA